MTNQVRSKRQPRLVRLLAELRQDSAFGLRLLARAPGFTVTVVATLAVAIGGNTAVFSLANALFLKPVPVRSPEQLVRIYSGQSGMSWPNGDEIARRNPVFSDVVAQRIASTSMGTPDGPIRLTARVVSDNHFAVLGVPAALGRPFFPGDGRRDAIVLSERLWRTSFGSDPAIIGRTIVLDEHTYEIVAVMPRIFRGIAPPGLVPDLWRAMDVTGRDRSLATDRSATAFEVFGRLRENVSVEQAAAAMRVLGAQLQSEHPAVNESFGSMEVFAVSGVGVYRGLAGSLMPVFAFLVLMTAIAGFVLLVGCANIAGLLVGRAVVRQREIAMRLALGAGRGRLIRQLVTESLLLGGTGGVGGVVLAMWLTSVLGSLGSGLPIPIEIDLSLDYRMLAYALGLSLMTALVFGLAPARRAARSDVIAVLKEGSSASSPLRLRHALLFVQVLVCAALLAWGSLFTRSLLNVSRVDPGFDPRGVVLAELSILDRSKAHANEHEAALRALQARAGELPGVQSTGMVFAVPLSLRSRQEYDVRTSPESTDDVRIMSNVVTPGYFQTVRIPVIAGRDISWADRAESSPVLLVNETAARRFWNGNAVGQRLRLPQGGWHDVEVIGVVKDSRYWTLGETTPPTVYVPFSQAYISEMTLCVRSTMPAATFKELRREVAALGETATGEVRYMTDAVAVAVMPARVGAFVTAAFGAVAMLLAMTGVYGLVAFLVAQRTHEIGIRKAVGARTADIVRLILRENLTRVALGLGCGLAFGSLSASLFGGFIVDVSPFDPFTWAVVGVIVFGAAIVASLGPALRAARVDALALLKSE
jgi:predicted permease